MSRLVLNGIVALIRQAQALASSIGIPNILQPGLVKEMIIAEILGHEVIYTKHDSDARDPEDPNVLFEYLSCLEGGTGQLDRVFNRPEAKRRASIQRIRRNRKVYLAIFFKKEPLKVKVIYELDPETVAKETEAKLDRSSNEISHVGFSEPWAKVNGKVVYSTS
ncbi:MAG: hypothetical protein JNM31_16050 [Flavobacteriales bacterium]|nr:hypothetical protein [Flavobacteriales bacterium]